MLPSSRSDIGPRGFIPCYVCHRKVSRHSLVFHEPMCLLRSQANDCLLPSKREAAPRKGIHKETGARTSRRMQVEPPNLVPCYVCHRKVSRHSMEFHESKCLLRWEAHNNLLPENDRQPTPTKKSNTSNDDDKKNKKGKEGHSVIQCENRKISETATFVFDRPNEIIFKSDGATERPRTQTLKGPSPNVIHPVIKAVENPIPEKTNQIDSTKLKNSKSKCTYKNRKTKSLTEENLLTSQFSLGILSLAENCTHTLDRTMENDGSYDYETKPRRYKACEKDILQGAEIFLSSNYCDINHEADYSVQIDRIRVKKTRGKCKKPSRTCTDLNDVEDANGLKLIICYICGQRFSSRGFQIHEPRCVERWELANQNLPVAEREQKPARPSSDNKKCLCSSPCSPPFTPKYTYSKHSNNPSSTANYKENASERKKKSNFEIQNSNSPRNPTHNRSFNCQSVITNDEQCHKRKEEQVPKDDQEEMPQNHDIIIDKNCSADEESLDLTACYDNQNITTSCTYSDRIQLSEKLQK